MGVLQLKLIKKMLDENDVKYEVFEHEPVYTSKQAAEVRGEELKTGVKSLVLKNEDQAFIMALIAGDKRMDLKKLAKVIGTKKLRLASGKEVKKITGCEIGSVHPFGNLHKLETYLDDSILENQTVNFNAGLHTVTMQMSTKELIRIVKPRRATFSST